MYSIYLQNFHDSDNVFVRVYLLARISTKSFDLVDTISKLSNTEFLKLIDNDDDSDNYYNEYFKKLDHNLDNYNTSLIKLYKNKCVPINYTYDFTYYEYIIDGVETYNKSEPYCIHPSGKIMNYITLNVNIPQTLISINMLYSQLQASTSDAEVNNENLHKYLYLANNGHIDAMIDIAYYYCMIENHIMEKHYYKMALKKGSTKAAIELGMYYMFYNKTKELKYYNKAAENGDADGLIEIGNYYKRNNNYKLMKKYYCKALKHTYNVYALIDVLNYYKNKHKYYKLKKYLHLTQLNIYMCFHNINALIREYYVDIEHFYEYSHVYNKSRAGSPFDIEPVEP